MTIHNEESKFAGKIVKVKSGEFAGQDYRVEDWWDRVGGKSWMFCDGNFACLDYAYRSSGLPLDDEVLYGKIGSFGKLIHISQIETGE